MGKLIVSEFMSLDGVMEVPGPFFAEAPHVTLKAIETRDTDRGVTLMRYAI